MIATAKLFQNDESQAAALSTEFGFEDDRFAIPKVGKSVVFAPLDNPWEKFFAALEMFTDDFMAEGRQQPTEQQVREGLDDLFD